MKYFTTVGEQEFVIEIDQDKKILVNGEPYEIDFQQLPDAGVATLLLNNRSLEAFVEERDDDTWEVLIHGELYTVSVQDERAHRLAKARGIGTSTTGDATVKSPMPGIIVMVLVSEGDVVSKGDKVVILESMKMENELKAPRDGVVVRVQVKPGQSVEKGEALVVIGEAAEEALE